MGKQHYWVVRFDYDVPLKSPPGKTYRQTTRLGVVAATIESAVYAVLARSEEFPNAVVWGVNHQGAVDVEARA